MCTILATMSPRMTWCSVADSLRHHGQVAQAHSLMLTSMDPQKLEDISPLEIVPFDFGINSIGLDGTRLASMKQLGYQEFLRTLN